MPKGVLYTHAMFAEQIEQLRQLYGIQPGEIDLPTFPLFALFGPALGMTEVLPEMDFTRPAQADPVKLVAAIERFRFCDVQSEPAIDHAAPGETVQPRRHAPAPEPATCTRPSAGLGC